jgi:RHS repeat-associated protein
MAMAAQLSENSHQGFEGIKAALCLASMEAKSNPASGMPVCLWQNGTRSRSSGKERDAETGLDYFGARYLSAAQGRWTSPDPLLGRGRPENPQSWNRYTYTLNNPLKFTDPTGLQEEENGFLDMCLRYFGLKSGLDDRPVFEMPLRPGGRPVDVGEVYIDKTLEGMKVVGDIAEFVDYSNTISFTKSMLQRDKTGMAIAVAGMVPIGKPIGKGLKVVRIRFLTKAAAGLEEHHLLSQTFESFWRSAGINDWEKFKIYLPKPEHRMKIGQGLHTGKGLENWNPAWEAWINKNPNATQTEVWGQLYEMMRSFNLIK